MTGAPQVGYRSARGGAERLPAGALGNPAGSFAAGLGYDAAMVSTRFRTALWSLALIALWQADEGRAESPSVAADTAQEAAQALEVDESVDLDLLLRLPDSYTVDGRRRGGAGRSEWRTRFFEARETLDAEKATLAKLHRKMEGMAGSGGSWSAGAPGMSNPDPQQSTLNYKLRQDLRRARVAVSQAEKELRALRVEADLAAVPESWRE